MCWLPMGDWRSTGGREERNEDRLRLVLTQESLHEGLPLRPPADPELRVAVGARNSPGWRSNCPQLCFALLLVLTVAQGTGDSRVRIGRKGRTPVCALGGHLSHFVGVLTVLALSGIPLPGRAERCLMLHLHGFSTLQGPVNDPVLPSGGDLGLPGALAGRRVKTLSIVLGFLLLRYNTVMKAT